MFVQTFKILGFMIGPQKYLTQISPRLIFEWQMEKGKMEKEGKINTVSWFSFTQ